MAEWRDRFQPASFRGAAFHVEQQSRTSGRRVVVHEYPKRDNPYSEDMGRQAVRYQITGYCIGPFYQQRKEALLDALEQEGAGSLVDPYMPRDFQAMCERYSVTEVRERGGYCVFEMLFVEAGDSVQAGADTKGDVLSKADLVATSVASDTNIRALGVSGFTGSLRPPPPPTATSTKTIIVDPGHMTVDG
jgi:prophage DNA circulation protein